MLLRLENKDEKVRAGALLVIKHLVNSGGAHMEVKKALIISGLRIMTQEPSLKVGGPCRKIRKVRSAMLFCIY